MNYRINLSLSAEKKKGAIRHFIGIAFNLGTTVTLRILKISIHEYRCLSIYLDLSFIKKKKGFPSSLVGKKSACNVGDLGSILGSEDPLEKEMATHSSTFSWRISKREEPGRLQSKGLQRSDMTVQLTFTFHLLK